jgi:PhzF family phenazine biosynthesis protein
MTSAIFMHVNAFTETSFEGNPAGVVLTKGRLSPGKMQLIAREINVSETAFVLPPGLAGADIQIRWFTPTNEVPLCGHATVAAFHALAEDNLFGMKARGEYLWRLQTKSGILRVLVEKKRGAIQVKFSLPLPEFKPLLSVEKDIYPALGLSARDWDPSLPAVQWRNAFVSVNRLSTLGKVTPDFEELKKVLRRRKLAGISVFCRETRENRSDFHSRYFAPNDGINEDPVTGSANGPLGVYALEYGIREKKGDGIYRLIGEQGDFIGRRGRVGIEIAVKDGAVVDSAIVGRAVTLCKGTLEC